MSLCILHINDKYLKATRFIFMWPMHGVRLNTHAMHALLFCYNHMQAK